MIKRKLKLNFLSWLSLITLCLALGGCGYRSTCQSFCDSKPIVSIPLIKGDENGYLRNDLAREISKIRGVTYSSATTAPYRLDVKIIQDTKETIGYIWDVHPKTGKPLNRLYPNEGRRKMKISVTLYDTVKKVKVTNPFVVEGFTDYDFVNPTAPQNIEFTNSAGQVNSVLQFSLGQLDSEEGARSESFQPLSESLAHQVSYALQLALTKKN